MPKPVKYAPQICIALSLLALAGVVWGLLITSPLVMLIFILPAVAYEVYRTEGASTKWASWGILAVLVLEFVLILFRIDIDLAALMGASSQYVGGYHVPLGRISALGPVLIGILSVILFTRTNGPYTKWLSVVILATCLAMLFTIDTGIFKQILRLGVDQGFNRLRF